MPRKTDSRRLGTIPCNKSLLLSLRTFGILESFLCKFTQPRDSQRREGFHVVRLRTPPRRCQEVSRRLQEMPRRLQDANRIVLQRGITTTIVHIGIQDMPKKLRDALDPRRFQDAFKNAKKAPSGQSNCSSS